MAENCSGAPSGALARRLPSLALAAVLVAAVAVRLPTWTLTHREPDEVIYWALAQSLAERGQYGLEGTRLLEQVRLPAEMYDRPLFHHPPLFPLTLVPFARGSSVEPQHEAIVVPWIGALLCVVAVALGARRALADRAPGVEAPCPAASGIALVLGLAVLGMALDPLSLFLSRKLWIDLPLAGLTSFGLASVLTAGSAQRARTWYAVGGLALGLAALAKLVAVLALPVAALAICCDARRTPSGTASESAGTPRPGLCARLAWTLAPALALAGTWLAIFWHQYGTLIPWWSAPSEEMLVRDAFIRAACDRPAFYYAARFALVQPVLLVALAGILTRPRALRRTTTLVALAWIATFVVALTWIGQSGNSPHFVRYLAPAFPASYVLLASALAEHEGRARTALTTAAVCAIAYGVWEAWPYLATSSGNEILSPLERALGLWT